MSTIHPTAQVAPGSDSGSDSRGTRGDYDLSGMTCGSCVATVRQRLESIPEVSAAEVDRTRGAVSLSLKQPVPLSTLQAALGAGKYTISEALPPAAPTSEGQVGTQVADPLGARDPQPRRAAAPATRGEQTETSPVGPSTGADAPATDASGAADAPSRTWLETYRPLLVIIGLVALVSVLAQAPFGDGLDGMLWMRHFMAGFFIVFAGFKLLDVRGFSESYRMYDLVAQRWPTWGLVYPFVELALGLAYLTDIAPAWTNVATVVVLGVSAIGVIRSVLDRRAIRCACLGTGFNLPMTTVTIVEDLGMVGMAVAMLILR